MARIKRQANDAGREGHTHHPSGFYEGQSAPAFPAIVTAIDRGRRRAEVEDLWIVRVKAERPHHPFIRTHETFPVVTTVHTAIQTLLGTCIHDLWVIRMDGDSAHFGFVR